MEHDGSSMATTDGRMAEPVLEAHEVSKRFAGVVALERVSLQLRPGEVHALVGENGAGKSTLIKVLTGLHQPDDGEVRYHGDAVTFQVPRDAWDAGIATTYQEIGLVPQMSVARNLFLGREPTTRLGLLDVGRMHAMAEELLGRYGISVDVRREVGDLGVATRQMVTIVRAVSADSRVVILDEPTSSLEPREVDRLARMVSLLQQQGVALLYVTHKLDEVFRMCDRITVLRDGRRVHTGDVAGLTRLQLVSTMLGRDASELASHGMTGFEEAHDATGAVVLRASGLSRRNLLDDVSLDIREGEVVALAGLLGSGRSETAMAIFGDQRLDEGRVEIDGKAVRSGSPAAAIHAGIAMLPEDRKAEGLIPTLSVRENIVLAALPGLTRLGIVSRAQVDQVVDRFIQRMRIKVSSADQRVSQLSGGNQQKVLLARMLALDPRLLMLDEPTRGIDVGAKAEVQTLIDELARDGQAVLLISSELEEIVEGADRVVVLKDGRVIATLQGEGITEDLIMNRIASADPTGGAMVDG